MDKKELKTRHKKSDAIKKLERRADRFAQIKYPNTNPDWLAPRKYSDKTANSLTKCIIDFIRFEGFQAERINTTGRIINNQKVCRDFIGRTQLVGQGAKYIPTTGSRGSADISSTIRSRSIKIEIKIGRDRQSEYQKQYQMDVERAGGVYIIARNFTDFFNWYNHFTNE